MQFPENTPLYAHEVRREAGEDVLYINFVGADFVPNLADSPDVMEKVIDLLLENPNVSRIVLVQQKSYNYDSRETNALLELAQFHNYLVKQEQILSNQKTYMKNSQFYSQRYNELFSFLFLLKQDPVLAYFNLKKIIVETKINLDKVPIEIKEDLENYIYFLEKILRLFEKTTFISEIQKHFNDYVYGNRDIYSLFFTPDVLPNFSFTRLVADIPSGAEIMDQYEVSINDYDKSVVTIFKKQDQAKLIYHINPPENSLSDEHNKILNLARSVLIEHQPKAEEFTDTERIRQVFFNIAKDLLNDLANNQGFVLSYRDINLLSTILVRHTIGFGLMEVLLQDKNLQDIVLNAPIPQTRIYLRHNLYNECETNILPSQEDVDSWAAKFRMISGRPLDEANPILDTQLEIGSLRARIAIIQQPLSPDGLAYAIRRHREAPWTLPLFIKAKMINPLGAGLLSFLIDGSRTLLVAGTRSSGKTSLLGSLMLEIIPNHRIIVIEDSLELPVESLRKLRYDILRMKVRSALLKTTAEVSASDGIRTSLRLGDSCLIIGEVRSAEARALYEAMRVGALANVVAGTIHGASPYGVFDRVVNDLEVPATSFKATDIIVVCNPIKSPDGLSSVRRVIQISEVRKHWKDDPLLEKGFVDLMKYNVEKDELEPTDDLINGDSDVLKDIASNVRGWAGNWDAIWDNVLLRAKIKEEVVKIAEKNNKPEILESEFNQLSNHMFHKFSEKVIAEYGLPWEKYVFPLWKDWIEKEVKNM